MTQLICGMLRLDGAVPDEALLRRMAVAMVAAGLRYRVEVATCGPAAFAALRLARRGAEADPAPPALIAEDGSLLAADITVYDRTRMGLADDGGPGIAFLRAALMQRGEGALGALHGDFALAAWRDGVLTLARDHFGVRPLVYAHSPGRYLAFGSSPAALLRTGLASDALDEEVAASWVLNFAPPPGRSIYTNIRPVDAAHLVECRGGAVTARRYWRLGIDRRLPFSSDPRALADETRRRLTLAVERRLPQAGPGAGHLSGGLDSSPPAVLGARALARDGRGFHAYSFAEPDRGPGLPGVGDAPMAARVAAAEPAITEVPVTAPSLLSIYAEGVDPETLLPLSLRDPEEQALRHAAAHGATVMLAGWGGDQVVSYHGRGAEAELLYAGRWLRLARHLRAEAAATGLGLGALIRSTVLVQGLPRRLRALLRRLTGRADAAGKAIAQQSRLVARHRRGCLLVEPLADHGTTHRIRRDKTEAWYIQARLESFALQGARHGVAYAFPMFDLDLVEFSIQVPGIFLRSDGWRRRLLRQALAGILPDEVRLSQPKLRPFPGEELRIAAARDQLLGVVEGWRSNPRIGDLLDLDLIAERIRRAAEPGLPEELADIDLAAAFQIGALVSALDARAADAVADTAS